MSDHVLAGDGEILGTILLQRLLSAYGLWLTLVWSNFQLVQLAPGCFGFQKDFGLVHGFFSATLGVYCPWRSQRNVPSSIVGHQGGQEQVEFGFAAVDSPKGMARGVIHHSAIISAWPHLRMELRYRTLLLTNVCMLFTLWLSSVHFACVCMWMWSVFLRPHNNSQDKYHKSVLCYD